MKKIRGRVYISEKAARRPSPGNRMKRSLRLVAGPTLLLALAACHSSTGNSTQDTPMELKAYSVPNQQTADLVKALNQSLSEQKAHASTAMPGKILVYAPRDTQESIGTVIDELSKSAPAKPVETPLQVHFWMIEAEPGAGNDDPALLPLSDTLKALRASLGPQHFNLVESVSGQSSGSGALIIGNGHVYEFNGHVNDSGIHLDLNYQDQVSHGLGIQSLRVELTVQTGQYAVLGQAQAAGNGAGAAPQAARFLIARVDALKPTN